MSLYNEFQSSKKTDKLLLQVKLYCLRQSGREDPVYTCLSGILCLFCSLNPDLNPIIKNFSCRSNHIVAMIGEHPVCIWLLGRLLSVCSSNPSFKRFLLQVKSYCLRQWEKILSGRVSLADFVFAKEVRLGTYSNKGPAPPAAMVAAKAIAQDPRAEPRFSERVPYIVVHGPPGKLFFSSWWLYNRYIIMQNNVVSEQKTLFLLSMIVQESVISEVETLTIREINIFWIMLRSKRRQ